MKFIRMINRFKYLILGITAAFALGFYTPEDEASKKDQVILNLVYNVLNSSHFAPQEINDEFSEKVFDHFIETLDYSKRFYLQSDVEELKKYRTRIDDQIKGSNLDFFEKAFAKYQKRFAETEDFYHEILAEPFDYTKEETFQTDEEKLEYASSNAELKERWRKYLKHRVLSRVEDRMNTQADSEDASDTTDVEDEEPKTFEELEKEAREKELEMHEDWYSNLKDMEDIDWLGMYLNSITGVYDPHTQYFPPQKQEDFEISMTGQIEGIGAQLQQKGDYVTISKVITGSPCWKQGDLEVGDKILKVQQGDETEDEAVDVVGMAVRKVVTYIRGPKGTEVILTVQKMDGSKMVIPIVRDVVELEATFAKSAVLGEGDDKVGYIRLPKFYVNFYGEDNRNCAEDVKAELEKLKAENVNGVILDLRNNGGGSLQGVIDIVGLFIDEGPVVQVKQPGHAAKVLKDKNKGTTYDGPLIVMVNQFSASASEIFAAAIQDYKRGLIIGSKSTFGKGTVQNVVDMDRMVNLSANSMKPLGALKLTIQKYYRINGGTPQLKGVHPEIVLPDNYNYIEFGEKEHQYALPYDEISSASYDVWKSNANQFESAIANSRQRIESDPKFKLIDEYAVWLKEEREDTEVSLNYEKYHQDQEAFRERSERYDGMRKTDDKLMVSSSAADVSKWESSEDKQQERDRWFKNLSTDLYLHEAALVMKDLY